MRTRIVLAALGAALAAGLGAPSALATDCSGFYSPCINDDTLWLHAGASSFVAIGSTRTVAQQQVAFGLVASYLSRPIVLSVPGPGGDQYAVNDQVNGTFLWGYGVTDRLELDLAVPVTFGQGGTGLAPLTGGNALKDTAVRDLRFGFAYAMLPRGSDWGLAPRLEISAPTGDSDQFAGERSGVIVPSIAADWRSGRFFAGAEVGARLRPTTQLLGARVGSQIVTAVGVGYDALSRRDLLTFALEAWALPTLVEQATFTKQSELVSLSVPNGQTITPAEWQLSARTAPLRGGDLSVQASGGGPIPFGSDPAITTPRFRFTLGVRWAPRPRDGNRTTEGGALTHASPVDLQLASAHDVCTTEPDIVDGFRDDDGCPDEDQDKDGVPDRLDRCPLVPEDFAGLTDGCPEKP
jgi:hypothetical protein